MAEWKCASSNVRLPVSKLKNSFKENTMNKFRFISQLLCTPRGQIIQIFGQGLWLADHNIQLNG